MKTVSLTRGLFKRCVDLNVCLIEEDNDGITDPGLTSGEHGHDEIHYVRSWSNLEEETRTG